jgi:hypothetical protein
MHCNTWNVILIISGFIIMINSCICFIIRINDGIKLRH